MEQCLGQTCWSSAHAGGWHSREGEWPYFRLVKYCNLPRYIYIYSMKKSSGNESFQKRFSLRGEGGRAYRGQLSGLRGAAKGHPEELEKNTTGYITIMKSNGYYIVM